MLDLQNEQKPKSAVLETTHALIDVEVTQKIEFDHNEIVGAGNSNKKTSTSRNVNIADLFNKKSLFSKKSIPDDYVKTSSIVCMVSSIPSLEKELKLSNIDDNYILGEKIAEGGQGVILSGFDKSLKRDVVIKSAKIKKNNTLKNKNLFVSEARIMAKLDHPSIAPIYGMYSDSQDKLHLAMKQIKGKNLKDYLYGISILYQHRGIGEYAEKDSILHRIEYLIKVCEAVDYAHCKGIIHRDIKPENIIIGSHGETYLMDWGLACLFAPEKKPGSKHLTEIGLHLRCELAGTPCYLAPELIRGGLTSPQSDIFSLGMVLFEIVTLTRAVPGETVNEVLKNIIEEKYMPFKHRFLKNKLSDDLKAIIGKATSASLCKRYETANDMAKDLRSYLMRNETVARPDNFLRKYLRKISHNIMITSSVVLGIILCLTIVALYGLHSQNILINKQKIRESMLTHFHDDLNKRSSKLNYAVHYFENQLTNLVRHSEYILNTKANTVNKVTRAEKSVLHKILKHMLSISNLKFEQQTANSSKHKPVSGIFIIFKDGSILSHQGNTKYETDHYLNKRECHKKALKNKNVISWSKPLKCVICKKIVICCFLRISDENNKALGVIGMDIDLEYIHKNLFKNTVPGMREFLINKEGEVLLSHNFKRKDIKINPETNNLILKTFVFNKEFQIAIKKKSLRFRGRRYNKEYIYGISYIPSLGYYYVEQTSEKRLRKDYHKYLKIDYNKI